METRLLRELGLSQKEIDVYLTVLEYGKLSPARLASLTGIHRTTVYAVAKELVKKGYLVEDSLNEGIYYSPSSAKDLLKVAKKERQTLIAKELLLEELAKSVQEMPQSRSYAVPKIKFIEGEAKVAEFLYERSRKWSENCPDGTTWWGFQDHSFVEHEAYRDWVKWFWNPAQENVDLKLISNDAEIEKRMQEEHIRQRRIKFWKAGFSFTTTQWIVGEYSIMVQTRQSPHYLVEMHDAVYCENMRELFRNLWEEIG